MSKHVDWLVTELNVIGGTEIFLRQTAPLLRESGWDLRIITLVSGGKLVEALRQEGIPIIELGLKHKLDFGIVPRLMRIWKQDPPDILHTHLYHAGILGRCVARWMDISPVLVHQHGPENARSGFRMQLDRLLSPWVNRYICTCEAVSQVLKTREGIPAAKIDVIYNGISLPDVSIDFTRLENWPVPEETTTLICVGRLSPEKGQFLLLEALASIKDTLLPIHTIFVGVGSQMDALLAHSERLDIQAQVSFVGFQQDIYSWLRHADIFILPSEWEGVSLALLEAMAAGLPVVATKVGGTPEVVVDGQTGILVPPGDPHALANAILELVAHPIKCQRMGQVGKQRVQQKFSIQETIRKTEQLYTGILTKP